MWRGAASSSPMIHPTTEFASVLHVSTRNMNRQMPCLAKDGNKGPFLSLAHRRKSRRCQDYFAIRNDPGRMARRRPGTRARTSICPSVRCRRIRSSRIFAAAASHSRSPKNEQTDHAIREGGSRIVFHPQKERIDLVQRSGRGRWQTLLPYLGSLFLSPPSPNFRRRRHSNEEDISLDIGLSIPSSVLTGIDFGFETANRLQRRKFHLRVPPPPSRLARIPDK